jgi:hypothetical protein
MSAATSTLRNALSRSARLVVAAASLAACAVASAVPPGDGPFGSAVVVPADASMVLRMRDAKGMRSDALMLRAQSSLLQLAGSRVLSQAWDTLAAELGMDPSALVDGLIGTDITYAERTRDGKVEWAAVTKVEQPLHDLLVAKLKPAAGAGGRAVFPVQQIASAWRPPYLVLGPSDRTALLEDVVARIDAAKSEGSLAAAADLAPALTWETAPVEVIWQHPVPTGGLSAFSARMVDGKLRVRHRSRFDRAPIHVSSGAPADAGLLDSLEGAGIAALVMNPWRGEMDASEPVDAFLMEGGFDDAMRSNMGARQLVVVGDVALEGTRVRVPTLGVAFEVRDPVLAEAQWDGWGQRFAESVARRAGLPAPEAVARQPGVPRVADISPAMRSLFQDHPFVRSVRLAWSSVASPNGTWQAVATDPALLAQLAERISKASRVAASDDAHEVGVLSGRALAAHLRSWTTDPGMFVPETPDPFVQAATLAADIVSVAQRVRWRARAPATGVIESEVVVEFPKGAPAEAAPVAPPAASSPK